MEKAKEQLPVAFPYNNVGVGNVVKGRTALRRLVIILPVALLVLVSYGTIFSPNDARSYSAPHEPAIHWTPCGDNVECGRLTVPLDYANASAGVASLALARYLATNKTARLGTLMTNPGGPGGSGVNYIYRAGPRISDLVQGRYDIVSWDPRGINGTTPRVECFASQTDQDVFFANTHQEILPDTRNLSDPVDFAIFKNGVRLADARNAALSQLCIEMSGEGLRHVGTATVVRDLESIYSTLEGEDALINFWGFSYGTVVGSYLVNMFPNRIGRVIIDGVVDPDLWANTHSHEWLKWDFNDTDKDLNNFYEACAAAGPDRCSLATNSSTAQSIAADVDKLLDDLYERPLPVPHANRPNALTASTVKALMFTSLYAPRNWPNLASYLAAAIKGDGAPILNVVLDTIELDKKVPASTAAAITAVTCVDTPSFKGVTKDEAFDDILNEIVISEKETSRLFSSLVIESCHHWTVRETERFTGPFNSSLNSEILIIGNTADPITPVQNAHAVNNFLGKSSRLIVQDGSGHCSSAMASLCTSKAIREYFTSGTLPENGIVCQTDEVLFPVSPATNAADNAESSLSWLSADTLSTLSAEDLELLETSRALGQALEPFTSMFKRPNMRLR